MGQGQSRVSKLASKSTKHNPLSFGSTDKLKPERASQLQLILKKCKEQPSQVVLKDSSQTCNGRPGKNKTKSKGKRSGAESGDEVAGHSEKQQRVGNGCPSRHSASSVGDIQTNCTTSESTVDQRTDCGAARERPRTSVSSIEISAPLPLGTPQEPMHLKHPAQPSKRKRKQRKSLKSLKLRRGSNSSLVPRRRSSRRKREMNQLSKSWLTVSSNLDDLGMAMFKRVADLCPEITRTISGLPEGTPISTHLLLSHPRARQHARRVMETVGMVVESYGEFDRVRPLLVMLGRHHAKYGVEEKQLMMIGEALIFTLQDYLAEEWSASLADIWANMYAMIYGALLEGIKQRQTPANTLERGHPARASFRQGPPSSISSPVNSSRSSPTGNTRKPGLKRKLSRRNTNSGNKSSIVAGSERKSSV